MATQPDTPPAYVAIDGDLYPADRIGPDGRPLPITEEQAQAIAEVLLCEYETNPEFRAAVDKRVKKLAKERGVA